MNGEQILVNGNEAAAWAAIDADIDYFSHYPGSPVNLIEPYLKSLDKKFKANIKFNDALNEHIAALAAAGASYCNARSLVVMKHVGMNIAADPFNYLGYTGVNGGMVIIVGTDPGANCSTGEEDVHWYIPQINFPLFEPTSIKEIYDSVRNGFIVSEKYKLPVVVFMPTRLCYNFDVINLNGSADASKKQKDFFFKKNDALYVNVGQRTINNHKALLNKIENIEERKENSKRYFNANAKQGIITRGITFGHTYETIKKFQLDEKLDHLNVNMVYPIPKETIKKFSKGKEEIIFIEDQDGFLENQVKMELFNEIKCEIHGKDIFPKYGEIQVTHVVDYLKNKFDVTIDETPIDNKVIEVPERLGTFCEGCPHRAAYYAIYKLFNSFDIIIGGDIGCSSLPPFKADWLLCMNAGIGISQGMSQMLEKQKVISTGGDGSFFHAGLTSLQSAVLNKLNFLHVVFDNSYVAMTGHQDSPTSGNQLNTKRLLKTIGVDRVYEIKAIDVKSIEETLTKEMNGSGVRVIWIRGECVRKPSDLRVLIRKTRKIEVKNKKCGSCTECYENFGCPAINRNSNGELAIDDERCMRCGTCMNVCENNALKSKFRTSLSQTLSEVKEFLIKK